MEKFDIIRIILLVLGIGILALFFMPLFVTHNPNIGAATGIGIGILLIIYGIWGRQINRWIAHGWHSRTGRIIEIVLLVICAAIIALAAATSAAMISGVSKTAKPHSTVIVLGARVYQNRPSTALKGRLDAAYAYLTDNSDSVCVVSGGQGKNEPCTESSVMYEYLVDKGIKPERIYQEDKSTDTRENLIYSRQLIEDLNLNREIAIVTDGYHEYRALKYAAEAGFDAGAVPASTTWWLFPTGVVREMYGILEQWFLK